MPIVNIEQPEIIEIDETLRLRRYDGQHDFALAWYQDEETLMLVDGKNEPYDTEKLNRMYRALNSWGELYFIEVLTDKGYEPIGDVTFWQEDMPIVIGDSSYRGQGIGKKVVRALISRAKELGYTYLLVDEIYFYNTGSRRLFESVGFKAYETTEKGNRYRLELEK